MKRLVIGHNEKKDTHTLDFDVTLGFRTKSLHMIISFVKKKGRFFLGYRYMKLVLDMGNRLARDRPARGNSNKCCFREEPRIGISKLFHSP